MYAKYKLAIVDTSDPYSPEERAHAEFDGGVPVTDVWAFADTQIARLEAAYPSGTYVGRLMETREDVEVTRP